MVANVANASEGAIDDALDTRCHCPLSFSLPQRWPFCWWVAVAVDHFSRRAMGCAAFNNQPTSEEVRHFLGRTIAKAKHYSPLPSGVRRNMKNAFMPLMDKILLRKRSLIETVNDQLKNIAQVEHTRHRSVLNFMVNLVAGLISYTRQPKKPTLRLHERDWQALNPHALTFVA